MLHRVPQGLLITSHGLLITSRVLPGLPDYLPTCLLCLPAKFLLAYLLTCLSTTYLPSGPLNFDAPVMPVLLVLPLVAGVSARRASTPGPLNFDAPIGAQKVHASEF